MGFTRILILSLVCCVSVNAHQCPYSKQNVAPRHYEDQSPYGYSDDSRIPSVEQFIESFISKKAPESGCPFGLKKQIVEGSSCPYGFKNDSMPISGCPHGFKNTGKRSGKGCPILGLKKQFVPGSKCPYGLHKDAFNVDDGICPYGFQKFAVTQTKCPFGFKQVLADGSKCPYGYTKSFNPKGGCPHGFKSSGSGKGCPIGFKKQTVAGTKCPYGYTSKAEATDGKCPRKFSLAAAPKKCPFGIKKKYIPGSKCPYGYTKESGANGDCPHGFKKSINSTSECPFNLKKRNVVGTKCPYGYLKSVATSGKCPHNFKKPSKSRVGYDADNSHLIENESKQELQYDYPVSKHDREIIKSTWDIAKKNGNIAPKAFLRYFKLKPNQQRMFPAFANISLVDLPTNIHFLNQAFTCVSSLNIYIDHLGKNPKNCPYLNSDKFKIDPKVVKEFGNIFIAVVEEELGDKFSAETKKIFKTVLSTSYTALNRQ